MKPSMFRFISVLLLSILPLLGCASRGSEFLGTGSMRKIRMTLLRSARNGDQYLFISKGNKVGATYEKGMREIKGILETTDLSHDEKNGSDLNTRVLRSSRVQESK
jgi:transketolase N-terminal domain/subunit